MNEYKNTIKRLYDLQKNGIKLGLSSIKKLLNRLDNPHLAIKCVHLAGTNGKGSVGAMLEATLLKADIKVGFYSSPHLIRFNERLRLAGAEIDELQLIKLTKIVWSAVDMHCPPSFFEFVTALAFLYYAREKAEWVILETGLGGRLDATNICHPTITLITNIGLEHQDYLGHTLAAIAFEKAGIIKSGIPLIHGITQQAARRIVEKRAITLNAPFFRLGRDIHFRRNVDLTFNLRGRFWKMADLSAKLIGRHQPLNAALALAVIEILAEIGVPITPIHFRQGLMQTSWPGRLDLLPQIPGQPLLWLDGAHNLPAARTLANNLDLVRANRFPLVLVLGIMSDKNYRGILAELVPAADLIIYSRPAYSRAAPPELLAAASPPGAPQGEIIQDLKQAIKRAKNLAGPEGVVLITGSLFTVGEAMIFLRKMYTKI